jgi:hypothetical protein
MRYQNLTLEADQRRHTPTFAEWWQLRYETLNLVDSLVRGGSPTTDRHRGRVEGIRSASRKHGGLPATDGPFAEAREQIGCSSMDNVEPLEHGTRSAMHGRMPRRMR